MRRLAILIALCIACPSLAHAEPTHHRWYGAKPALADGAAIALIGVAALVPRYGKPFVVGALGVYVAGAPIFETTEGHPLRGAASFVARLGIPVATYYAVQATHPQDHDDPGLTASIFAVGAGLLTAIVDDVTCIEATPYAAPLPSGGATAGVAGHF